MSKLTVKIGLVPSYRGGWGKIPEWCLKMRKNAISALNQIEGLELVVPEPSPEDGKTLDPHQGYVPGGAVGSLDQGEAVAEYFMREKVDGIIVCALNFGDERSVAKIAEKVQVPVLLYATKEPPARDDASLARVSDSYCGTLSIASGLYRRKIPFHFAGIFFHQDSEFIEEVKAYVRAVSVVKNLKGARIGQIGVRPPTFETVGYDEIAMIKKFGQNVIYKELSEIVLRAKSYVDDNPDVQRVIENFRATVDEITVAPDWLLKSAKMEVALAEFWNQNRLSAMAMQCWPAIQGMWEMSVCALFGRMTQRDMLTACETDVMGALAMLTNYSAALGETLPHFVDWTIQHREDPNVLLSWHCGNAPISLAAEDQKTGLRTRLDMKGEQISETDDKMSALYQFQLKPGKVTFCRLAEYDDEWKMLIAPGDIVPSDETLAGTWSWVRVTDHAHLYRTLVEEGFIHHASMIHGDQTQALVEACKFLNIRPVVVE